jgi:hypothetical protein
LSLRKSFDEVQGLFSRTQASSPLSTALQELAHTLEKLKDFMDFVSNEAKPPTDNSVFWGIVGLVVHVHAKLPFSQNLVSNGI